MVIRNRIRIPWSQTLASGKIGTKAIWPCEWYVYCETDLLKVNYFLIMAFTLIFFTNHVVVLITLQADLQHFSIGNSLHLFYWMWTVMVVYLFFFLWIICNCMWMIDFSCGQIRRCDSGWKSPGEIGAVLQISISYGESVVSRSPSSDKVWWM